MGGQGSDAAPAWAAWRRSDEARIGITAVLAEG